MNFYRNNRDDYGSYPRYESPIQSGVGCILRIFSLFGVVLILIFLGVGVYYNNLHTGALIEPSGWIQGLGNVVIVVAVIALIIFAM